MGFVPRRFPALTKIALTLGLCAWVLGSFASGLHYLLVQHVVCADHGELVELDHHDGPAIALADAPEISAIGHAEHDHGCQDELIDRTGVTSAPWVAAHALGHKRAPLPMTGADSPRGPPLAYAPKTSPPKTA